MADLGKVEYRVRKIERYVVTRHHESTDGRTGGTDQKGEFPNPEIAFEVAYALCADEHQRLGWPIGDERIQYPNGDQRYPTLSSDLAVA